MKQTSLLITFLFAFVFWVYSQSDQASKISFEGFYIAKTARVEAADLDIYTYLRFYNDGSVYQQAVASFDPQAVSAWFGRSKKFSKKGTYEINGEKISINMSNKGTDDIRLEGLEETTYHGTIKSANQICLMRNKEQKEFCFDFSKISDE